MRTMVHQKAISIYRFTVKEIYYYGQSDLVPHIKRERKASVEYFISNRCNLHRKKERFEAKMSYKTKREIITLNIVSSWTK